MNNDLTSFGLKDKCAIVTGASQGIGRTLAVGLAQAGVHLALVSRTQPALEEVSAEIEALGRKALVLPTDLREVSHIQAMVQKVHDDFGKIDILINNAAQTVRRPAGFYSHLLENEEKPLESLPKYARDLLTNCTSIISVVSISPNFKRQLFVFLKSTCCKSASNSPSGNTSLTTRVLSKLYGI